MDEVLQTIYIFYFYTHIYYLDFLRECLFFIWVYLDRIYSSVLPTQDSWLRHWILASRKDAIFLLEKRKIFAYICTTNLKMQLTTIKQDSKEQRIICLWSSALPLLPETYFCSVCLTAGFGSINYKLHFLSRAKFCKLH